MSSPDSASPSTTTSAWRGDTPLTSFLRTESGSAAILLVAAIAAIVWANVATESYASFWHTEVVAAVGRRGARP